MWSIGVAGKNARFIVLVRRPKRFWSKHKIVFRDFRPFGGIEHCVQHQCFWDLASFVLITDDDDDKAIYPLRIYMRGVIIAYRIRIALILTIRLHDYTIAIPLARQWPIVSTIPLLHACMLVTFYIPGWKFAWLRSYSWSTYIYTFVQSKVHKLISGATL